MKFNDIDIEVFEFDGNLLFNPRHVREALGLVIAIIKRHVREMNGYKKVTLKNSDCTSSSFRKFNNRAVF